MGKVKIKQTPVPRPLAARPSPLAPLGTASGTILPRDFFEAPTLHVARGLVGKYLVRELKGERIAGRIVEVEAYVGPEDRACHASRGRTPRTDVLFGPPGIAYVYLIYGKYHCFNVVTERDGYPAAVLLRAVQIGDGLIDGPGRLCRDLRIDRALNRMDLTEGSDLWFEDRDDPVSHDAVGQYPRIGVDYAGTWARKPWRFRLKGLGATRRTARSPAATHRK
jgi:DNA-3-methyladenine glycosylase